MGVPNLRKILENLMLENYTYTESSWLDKSSGGGATQGNWIKNLRRESVGASLCEISLRRKKRPPNPCVAAGLVSVTVVSGQPFQSRFWISLVSAAALSANTPADSSRQAAQLSPRAPLTAKVHWTVCWPFAMPALCFSQWVLIWLILSDLTKIACGRWRRRFIIIYS